MKCLIGEKRQRSTLVIRRIIVRDRFALSAARSPSAACLVHAVPAGPGLAMPTGGTRGPQSPNPHAALPAHGGHPRARNDATVLAALSPPMPTRGTPRFQQMEDERDERDIRFFFRRCLPAGAGRDGLFVLSLEPDGNGFGNE